MIVLASTSPIRQKLLRQAGLQLKTARPSTDETTIKQALKLVGAEPAEVAEELAEDKAGSVGAILPHAYVIGADQILDCDGEWFDKPGDRGAARRQLQQLRGKTHRLSCAVAISNEGKIIWRHVDRALLTMRDFSDQFLDHYLDSAGDAAFGSVGSYQLEGHGIQLFDQVQGDYFTILGLPLLPLLAALRQMGALPL